MEEVSQQPHAQHTRRKAFFLLSYPFTFPFDDPSPIAMAPLYTIRPNHQTIPDPFLKERGNKTCNVTVDIDEG
jgi:hypothetical protein